MILHASPFYYWLQGKGENGLKFAPIHLLWPLSQLVQKEFQGLILTILAWLAGIHLLPGGGGGRGKQGPALAIWWELHPSP